MIRTRHWHDLPSVLVREALPRFTWAAVDGASPGATTAALMLYVALRFMAEEMLDGQGGNAWFTRATYEELGEATGLSRNMLRDALTRLQAEKLITAEGSHQRRRYCLAWSEPGWFKVPCQAIVSGREIRPFKAFTLRSKHELHAMKLYLYLAAVRPNLAFHTELTYELIFKRLDISERDVRKAISLLVNCGLLSSVNRNGAESHGPNMYYLNGYRNLLKDSAMKGIKNAIVADHT